ncbi:fasciclin domain-containing protein [Maribacter sp. 2307ULW6-5]|uniref:fasciclin domain-containing protein n=1 Tax=Maribacter sp. 2307ULW6-5 TaxID=3386275 RepID=UPI0039BCD6DB
MMNKLIFKTCLAMAALFTFASCQEDSDERLEISLEGRGTVVDAIVRNSTVSTLESALGVATGNLTETLNGTGPFTVFAPSNDAFNNLAESLGLEDGAALLEVVDPDLLSQILTYHVVAGQVASTDLTDGGTVTTVLGDDLTVSLLEDGGVALFDASKLPETDTQALVTLADQEFNNGIVHFIDKVLLPKAAIDALDVDVRPNIVEWAVSTPDLSILVDALVLTDLVDTVSELDSITVLAPTNQAFSDLLDALGDDYNSLEDFDNDTEIALLGDVLKYHVLNARVGSTDLAPGEAATVLEDNAITIVANGQGFEFGDATTTNAGIVTADIDGSNGFVHIVDKVLLPEAALDFLALLASDDLATIVVETPALSVLEEALIATDLVAVFVDNTNIADPDATNFTYDNPVTVFAPTDDAFVALLEVLGDDYTSIASFDTEAELQLLTDILLYHVVSGKVTSDQLAEGPVTTVGGSDIDIIAQLGGTGFVIGDATNDVNATIAIPDVLARNGVAHVIDKVLLPQAAIDFVNSLD